GVPLFPQQTALRHHRGAIHTSAERIDRDVLLHARLAHAFADLPHLRAVDLTHGNALEATNSEHHAPQLVAGCDLLVDLEQDLERRLVAGSVGALERGFARGCEAFVHVEDAVLRDGLADRAGDRLARAHERVRFAHAFGDEARVQAFDD